MLKELYILLLNLVGARLLKENQRIFPDERLSLTILHLAHGVSLQYLACAYKLGKTTVRDIVLETCEVLWEVLSSAYVSESTQHQYKDIAWEFKTKWNMLNSVGAIDDKHIAIECPEKSGSAFDNYKKHFSTGLMAICDANYTFTGLSIGSFGSQSDGCTYAYEFLLH